MIAVSYLTACWNQSDKLETDGDGLGMQTAMEALGSLEGQLSDTQNSLAAALARIEGFRLRQRALEQENIHLRNVLRKRGINPGQAVEQDDEAESLELAQRQSQDDDENDPNVPNQSHTSSRLPQLGEGEQLAVLLQQVQPHAVVMHTDVGQIHGHVFISDDAFEFISVQAKVTPDKFVGVRFFNSPEKTQTIRTRSDSPSVQRQTWWDSIFGTQRSSSPRYADKVRMSCVPHSRHPSSDNSDTTWVSRPKLKSPKKSRSFSRAGSAAAAFRSADMDSQHPSSPRHQPSGASSSQALVSPATSPMLNSRTNSGAPVDALTSLANLTEFLQDYITRRSWQGLATSAQPDSCVKDILKPGLMFDEVRPQMDSGVSGDGVWQMIWKDGSGNLETLTFTASRETRNHIQQKVEQWSERQAGTPSQGSPQVRPDAGGLPPRPSSAQKSGRARVAGPSDADSGGSGFILAPPQHLVPWAEYCPPGAAASAILTRDMASALSSALPGRHRLSDWACVYSTATSGFSLQTMYRGGARCARTLLVVQDFHGHIFGAFCTEAWKVNPRYQGTGESFVFQMRPHMLKYGWQQPPHGQPRNDFFMLVALDSVGIGGGPHFALWLDSDLLHGHAGSCATFGCPTLAGSEDFKVKTLELWQVGS